MRVRHLMVLFAAILPGGCAGQGNSAAACAADPAHWARGPAGCLAIAAYGPARADTLVVVLHGDVSDGTPARYHRGTAMRVAEALPGAAAVAIVRPGYPDGDGRTSDGDANNRTDQYTRDNAGLVADAVAELRARTGARRVVAIGHSGGAAVVADVLALRPGTVDSAVLLACPCDIATWRAGRRPWTRSVDPMTVADGVPRTARVAAYTGSADTNTVSALARGYVARLAARGVEARFTEVPGATHDNVVGAVWDTDFPRVLARYAAE